VANKDGRDGRFDPNRWVSQNDHYARSEPGEYGGGPALKKPAHLPEVWPHPENHVKSGGKANPYADGDVDERL
jgi:hypothetical protein